MPIDRELSAATSRGSRFLRGLLLPIVLLSCSTPSWSAERATTVFYCKGDRLFTVEHDERGATVFYSGLRYDLPRRASSIGQRYASSRATLIIDGDLAAFVTKKVFDLDSCRAGEHFPK